MKWVRVAGGVAFCVSVLGFSPPHATAQPVFEVVRRFQAPAYRVAGKLVEGPSGRLYGTAMIGGPLGTGAVVAFDRQPDGSLVSSVLHAFTESEGLPVPGVLLGRDGALYGMTTDGGFDRLGIVYRLALDGSGFTVLHTFTPETGGEPHSPLMQASDGHLYGITNRDGSFLGVQPSIFRLTTDGVFTRLQDVGYAAAHTVTDPMIERPDGKLYGILSGDGGGAFFSLSLTTGEFTELYTFDTAGPWSPSSLIDGRDGFFYGATAHTGERQHNATVFRVSPAGAFTVLLTGDQSRPLGGISLIRGADGFFYGTTSAGGAGFGAIFRMTAAGALTTLHSFDFTHGAYPVAIAQTADGMLFGSTDSGGFTRTRGVIFRSTTAGQYSVAHMFLGSDPLRLSSSLLPGPDGAFYSASCEGGTFNAGTIYKIRPDGSQFSVLHSFAYWDGACPRGPLIFGHDGAIYGTASRYGLGGHGTIFRVTTTGALTPVFFFNGTNGSRPVGGLLLVSDGNYYGTTQFDGVNGAAGGTVFRLTPGGAFTTLHRFAAGFSEAPHIPLIQATNGHLYGATFSTPFRLTLEGTLTLFTRLGYGIVGTFTPGLDGDLYGVHRDYGGFGALFKMTLDGATTVLHEFDTEIEREPHAGLLLAPDGSFYGATLNTLFRFDGPGELVTLHRFFDEPGGGSFPFAQLTYGADGALYGTTLYGNGDSSVMFRLRLQ